MLPEVSWQAVGALRAGYDIEMNQSPPGVERVAFFGGSFDPPHQGHLAVARAARKALALDRVLFVPVGAQPLKPEGSAASFEDRVEMTRLAIAGEPQFEVSLLDEPGDLAGPNYTVDSLLRLRGELPFGAMLFCLMGADSFLSLRRWYKAAEIPFLASVVVASRPGLPLGDIQGALPDGLAILSDISVHSAAPGRGLGSGDVRSYLVGSADGRTAPLYLLPWLHVEVSASEIRDAIQAVDAAFRPQAPLLCPAVLEYIQSHGLYR
jgi:nicotinate-nucleotide adenylyltransferase